MKAILLSCCLFVIVSGCTDAVSGKKETATTTPPLSPKLSPEKKARLAEGVSRFMDSSFRKSSFNGALLVAQHGEIIYEQYNGTGHYRHGKDTIDASSPFHLASVSKTITGMTTLQLVQQGRIRLSDEVSAYLPGFPLQGVTVKTLLNHRSGLPNYVHYMERLGWDRKVRITNKDVLDFIIARHEEIDIARPDSRFNYSNTNFALLALVIEKITGKGYPEYLRDSVFAPLGMKHSFVYTSADSATAMPSYFFNGRQYAFDYLDLVYGDKNIYSTPQDLLLFDRALAEGKWINKSLLDSAYTPYSFEKPGIHNYGLGWRMLLLKNGKKLIYHNGWWHGNRTAFYRLVDEDAVIIALCNNDSRMMYSTKKLADLFGNYLQTGDSAGDEDNNTVQVATPKPHRKALAQARKPQPRKQHRTVAARK